MDLVYFYPMLKRLSFTIVAEEHISRLRKYINVHTCDEIVIDTAMWREKRNVALHPALYMLIGHDNETYVKKKHRISKIDKIASVKIAFDVADTDRISDLAVNILNDFDLIFVPSSFCKRVYENSGVDTKVVVAKHGISESIKSDNFDINSNVARQLLELKDKHGYKFVLFFLQHSGFRKGADVVYRAMKIVQNVRDDVVLIVKRANNVDPYIYPLRRLKTIEISGWLSADELRELYDVCDLTICPSRGGGFELNAIESIARGKPTIVTGAGCFEDYLNATIQISVKGRVKLFNDNIVHVGMGYDPDHEDLANKILEVLNNYESYADLFSRYRYYVISRFDWDKTVEIIAREVIKVAD